MAENNTGELRQCGDYLVTYYWTLPAVGSHLYSTISLIIISLLCAVFGTVANILVALAYFKNSRLRTLSNIPLISLAFSDLLVTTIVLPLNTGRLIKDIYGTHNCTFWTISRLSSYFSVGVSLLTITFISVERFITLRYPYRHQTILTRLRMKIIIAIIWSLTFALVISHFGLIPYRIFLALAGIVVIICIIVMLAIWAWISRLLRNLKRRITTHHRPSQSSRTEVNSSQVRNKNTRTSGFIVIGFILCYLPLVFMFAYYYTEPTNFIGIYLVTPWGEMVLLAHALFNPLFVFWRRSEFRQTGKNLICQLRCSTSDTINVIGYDNSMTRTRGADL